MTKQKKSKKSQQGAAGSQSKRSDTSRKQINMTQTKVRTTQPRMSGKAGTIHIVRTEMVGTITNAAVTGFAVLPDCFASNSYDVSASNAFMFPWLANVASAFEKFRFTKLTVRLVSGNSATTTGRVYMAHETDWDDPVPTTKAGLMGLAGAVDASAYGDVSMSVNMARVNAGYEWRYCGSSTRAVQEPRTAYAGFFAFGVDTPTANLVWDLWVDYEVDLMSPTSEFGTESNCTASNVPFTVGSDGAYYNTPILNQPATGPLKVVPAEKLPFTITWPTVNITIPSLIELPTGKLGSLSFNEAFNKAGVAPATLIDAPNSMTADARILDGKGTMLGYASTVPHFMRAIGAYTGVNIASAAANTMLQMGWSIGDMYALYRSAKYVHYFIKSAADPALSARQLTLESPV